MSRNEDIYLTEIIPSFEGIICLYSEPFIFIASFLEKFRLLKLFLLIFLFSIFPVKNIAIAGDTREILADISIKDVKVISSDSLEFTLGIKRNLTSWDKFANATFEIMFLDTLFFPVEPTDYSIEYITSSSELSVTSLVGTKPAKDFYHIIPMVRPRRFVIVISGPETYSMANIIPMDTALTIGHFLITGKNGKTVPKDLAWRTPAFYRQACAFKLERDSLIRDAIIYEPANSNIELDDSSKSRVDFLVTKPIQPVNNIADFYAIYAGNKTVQLIWNTASEAYNKGFVVLRAMKEGGNTNLQYVDSAADYRRNPELIGMGTHKPGKFYEYRYDTVKYRGEEYCYELKYHNSVNDSIITLDTACVYVPAAIIVEAESSPNPFHDETTIYFKVDEDVYMDCIVYDVNGKEVTRLLDNSFKPRNPEGSRYELNFKVSFNAQQGLYEVLFIATPINIRYLESSKASIKIQLIK